MRAQELLAHETLFPDRVMRDTPTQEDLAAGRPGSIVAVDGSLINFGRIQNRSVDGALEYKLASATFAIDGAAHSTGC